MRVIIAGSRSCNDPFLVARAIAESGFQIEQVVCGMARGVDLLGRAWALQHGSPVREMPALWRRKDGSLDMGAGHRRNRAMAACADALILIWDGASPGSLSMLGAARERHLKIHEVRFAQREQHLSRL